MLAHTNKYGSVICHDCQILELYDTLHEVATVPMPWCSKQGRLCIGKWNPLDLIVLPPMNKIFFWLSKCTL